MCMHRYHGYYRQESRLPLANHTASLLLVLCISQLLCETRATDQHFGMLICGGGWIVCRLVFEDLKGVRSTATFAKGLNH